MSTDINASNYRYSIVIIGILFFIFGFITWLNATLIPYLRVVCQIDSEMKVYLVTFAFYISYFFTALPSSWLLKKTGFKFGMSLGLITMATGAILFLPAALSKNYLLFLIALFVQGTGLSILQTASNPYVTILGPLESAAKRISIMGICNKVAGIMSPIILGSIVLKDFDALKEKLATLNQTDKAAELSLLADKVMLPYIIIAASLILLALMIKFSKLPEDIKTDIKDEDSKPQRSIFSYTYMWLGVLAIFVYVGAEVISVDTLIRYGEWLGIESNKAKFFSSITLFTMILGYIIAIVAIPKYITQAKALLVFSLIGGLFTILALLFNGFWSVLFISFLGLANSIMWPSIWPLAIEGLGRHTKTASALLVMGILGGALMPMLYGYFAENLDNHMAYIVLIPCYIYVIFYATKGYKINKIT